MAFVTTNLVFYLLFAVAACIFLFRRSKPVMHFGLGFLIILLMFLLKFPVLLLAPLTIFIFAISYQYLKRGSTA